MKEGDQPRPFRRRIEIYAVATENSRILFDCFGRKHVESANKEQVENTWTIHFHLELVRLGWKTARALLSKTEGAAGLKIHAPAELWKIKRNLSSRIFNPNWAQYFMLRIMFVFQSF